MSIESNIKGRGLAEDILMLFDDVVREQSEEVKGRVVEVLSDKFAELRGRVLCEKRPADELMTEQEAHVFEHTEVPFGAHQGLKVVEVEPSYWLWLTEQPFNKQLQRYVRSQHFQNRQ